jgi:hypothetical protein
MVSAIKNVPLPGIKTYTICVIMGVNYVTLGHRVVKDWNDEEAYRTYGHGSESRAKHWVKEHDE